MAGFATHAYSARPWKRATLSAGGGGEGTADAKLLAFFWPFEYHLRCLLDAPLWGVPPSACPGIRFPAGLGRRLLDRGVECGD